MKVAVAQINPTVGDVAGNARKLELTVSRFAGAVELVVFPELCLTGYPPRDLLEKGWFIARAEGALEDLRLFSRRYPSTGILFGLPSSTGKDTGKGLYNSAVLIAGGKILSRAHKSLLPTYDVFDEARYFDPAPEVEAVSFREERLGISICEDAWNVPEMWPRRFYSRDPMAALARNGATLFINISASPFWAGKEDRRYRLMANHCRRHRIPLIFVNQVGGNDELVFDGRSFCLDRNGEPGAVLGAFREEARVVESGGPGAGGGYLPQDRTESVFQALVLGVRDYMKKCGFRRAVLGLSGGIDSAVTAAVAVTAVGKQNVVGVSMPSPYTSPPSRRYARELARNLGIALKVIPIEGIYRGYRRSLGRTLKLKPGEIDTTLENIQARIRGNILMAFSNRFGFLVLSTGNKSELATGYCTLYGDMSGGLAVISDVPKTMVYELAAYLNRKKEMIPRGIIERPPTAELKPDQTDQDTLPPYPVLDEILDLYLEENRSPEEIVRSGFSPETVRWVVGAVNRNEYKRRQAAPGLKVTSKAFGMGRRMPIAATYEP